MLNKQDEKLLQELIKKYKQGIISGLYSGNNITFTPRGCRDKIISSTGGGAGNSSIFPNGLEEVTESRELTSSDIGKLLVIVNDSVILTPAEDMTTTGSLPQTFGIWCLNPTTKTSGFKVNTPSEICYLETLGIYFGGGQIVNFMVLYDDDLETTNIYPLTDIMVPDDFTGNIGQLAIPFLLESVSRVIPEYVNDAAADADTNLKSGQTYKLTGNRTVFVKP